MKDNFRNIVWLMFDSVDRSQVGMTHTLFIFALNIEMFVLVGLKQSPMVKAAYRIVLILVNDRLYRLSCLRKRVR